MARAAETCYRTCLEGFVNQCLDALGDGMWGPTVTMGNYNLYFADPQAGQVASSEPSRSMAIR